MPAKTLTAATLQNLKPPASGVAELWDTRSRGLCLRVFPSGRAAWSFRYRPKDGTGRRRIGLGEYPSIGLADARQRADRMRGNVADGADPQAERRAKRKAPNLSAVINLYLTREVDPKKKPSTARLYRGYLLDRIAPKLGDKIAHTITRTDIALLHGEIGADTPVVANRAIGALSTVFTFAARHGLVPEGCNPIRGLERFRETGRERYLTNDELGRLGDALRLGETRGLPWSRTAERRQSKHDRKPDNRVSRLSPHVAAAFRLLLLTGCRVGEILNLRWTEVDAERGMLFLADSKTGRKPVVLNAPALEILNNLPKLGEFVILGDNPASPRRDLNKPWNAIRRHAGLEGVRLHDLRHTHASVGASHGLGLPIIGKLLGHRNASTTQRYAHLDNDPVRRASDKIGGTIADALGGRT